jgi:hypothetical protein
MTSGAGSNDVANLYPEKRDVARGYKVKNKLEHTIDTAREEQKAIARNWETLYKKVYGVAPHETPGRAIRTLRVTQSPGGVRRYARCRRASVAVSSAGIRRLWSPPPR